MKKDPNERLSIAEIFNHPWIKKYEKYFNLNIDSHIYKDDRHTSSTDNTSRPESVKSIHDL